MSPVPDPAERHHLPMVCTCGPERAAAGEALYQRVRAALSRGSEELKARPVTDRTFVDDLLLSLLADHGATVEAIHGDQWFAVTVESFTSANEEMHVVCQCDQPTLGLAAIWEWYEQRKTQP
ncbi:hypothetical protein [Blastococcus sp. PRF04-17]|uniref:hypothetical protein n=1 Tax=Blastococcus sp. PRF04-17 TaxID=2933797 RepID=UPI001FF2344E|nr:hypothetical protein [Blastococcus sp. PRF04-17]UOY01639.1 hypothetical protein MVA48_22420 [Blastococcus sp. PRF04-17]